MDTKGVLITVVTPAYNRGKILQNLYQSLKNQTTKEFIWLVVDDGSTDDTEALVMGYQEEASFQVNYVKKENGGKHTALNVAIEQVKTELFFIVDSDDILTSDAIETVLSDWEHKRDDTLCGLSYLRGFDAAAVIGDSFPNDGERDTFISMRYNRGVGGDKAEVWVTGCLKEFGGFPVFDGEKFISESVLWIKIARKYEMIHRNKIIYITEYLKGGLSKTGRTLRFKCPQGMAYGSLETMTNDFTWIIRLKETLLYIVYSKFGKKSLQEMLRCPFPLWVSLAYLPGVLLYRIWKYQYKL